MSDSTISTSPPRCEPVIGNTVAKNTSQENVTAPPSPAHQRLPLPPPILPPPQSQLSAQAPPPISPPPIESIPPPTQNTPPSIPPPHPLSDDGAAQVLPPPLPPQVETPVLPPQPPKCADDDIKPPPPPAQPQITPPDDIKPPPILPPPASGGNGDGIQPPPIPREPSLQDKKIHFDELLETERTYVVQLEKLIVNFQKEFKDRPEYNVTSDQQLQLFSNLGQIFELHKIKVLPPLENVEQNWSEETLIGKVFCDLMNRFNCYVLYLTNHDRAVKLYKELKAKNKAFKKYMEAIEFSKMLDGLSFESLLIVPVQRLPRYSLLLKDILKATPEGHPDRTYIQKAMKGIGDIIQEINDKKKYEENKVKLRQLEPLLDMPKGALEKDRENRLLIKESDVMLQNKAFHLFGFDDEILFARPSGSKFHVKATYHLKDASFEVDDLTVLLNSASEKILPQYHNIVFPTALERDLFMKYITDAKDELNRNEERLARERNNTQTKDKNPMQSLAAFHITTVSRLHSLTIEKFKKVNEYQQLTQADITTLNQVAFYVSDVAQFIEQFNKALRPFVNTSSPAEIAACFKAYFTDFMRVFSQYTSSFAKLKQKFNAPTPTLSTFLSAFDTSNGMPMVDILEIPTSVVSKDYTYLTEIVESLEGKAPQEELNLILEVLPSFQILKGEIEKIKD